MSATDGLVAEMLADDLMGVLDELNKMGPDYATEAEGLPYHEVKRALVSLIRVAKKPLSWDQAKEVYGIMRDDDMSLGRAHRLWVQQARGVCGACGQGLYPDEEEHHCELAPAGETACLWFVLLPTLQEVAFLMEAVFRMTCGREPRWIEASETMVECDFASYRLDAMLLYYSGAADVVGVNGGPGGVA